MGKLAIRDAARPGPQTFRVYCGQAIDVLRGLPADSIDMCMTSPPYWKHREYDAPGIGQELTCEGFTTALCEILQEVKRVLKPQGSLWLNLGDSYDAKNLVGVPWRVAIKLMDKYHWILRNDVIWNKVKGAPDNSTDKLRNIHEHVVPLVSNRATIMNPRSCACLADSSNTEL